MKSPEALIDSCVGGSISQEAGLSNGDKVTYTWDCDKEYAREMFGCKLKYKDINCTVSDLEEAQSFDPFTGVDVTFEGEDGDGYAYVSGEPQEMAAQYLNFDLDQYESLSNGEQVVLTISNYGDDPTEYCILNFGMVPAALTKTYTVQGLGSSDESFGEHMNENMDEAGEDDFQGFVFPNSSVEPLWEDEVEELSDEDLRLAINELYARHGYIFKDEALRAYYEQFAWYEELINPDEFTMDMFNETERKNVELLQSERENRS